MNNIRIDSAELKAIFSAIGLANKSGVQYQNKLRKNRQVLDYLIHIEKAVSRLSQKRTLTLVDCACGKSYLSFIANFYLTKVLRRKVHFIGIDYNHYVIEQSIKAAHSLSLNNMNFICADIFKVALDKSPDIVFSLHACDSATDMAIAKGIIEKAQYIMAVSCCQHYVRSNMKNHPIKSITKFGIYKERIADMVADTMRSLVLEMAGYQTILFEYVPASETPKNIMIRAIKGNCRKKRIEQSAADYQKLKEIFQVEPKLMEYINKCSSKTL